MNTELMNEWPSTVRSGEFPAWFSFCVNEISRKPAHTVAELESAFQHQENWPTIMERAVEGTAGRGECGFPAEAGGP